MSIRKRRSPRLDLRNLDNQISRYPTVSRTGDASRRGKNRVFFDDTDTFFYTKYADTFSTGQIVSLPTSLPTGSKYLRSYMTTSFYVIGNAIKDNEMWMDPVRQYEQITPFSEYKLFEQDIKDTQFYATGSSYSDFGLGFISNLGSKTKISIEVPIRSSTQLQPRSASIYYLNNSLGRFEEVATSIRQRPYANLNMWEARMFNHLGSNMLSSSVNDVLQVGHLPNTPTEAASIPISYLRDALSLQTYDNMGRLLSLVNTQSALINSNFEATSSQYISMGSYISQPFMVEKVIMEIPIKAGPGWLRDYTRFVRCYSAINGYRFDPFDTGGPAITFGLINQLNRNNRDLILSATVIPANDDFVGQDFSPLWNERFASGFRSFGKPSYVVSSGSDGTFTGSITMHLEPGLSNGLMSLAFRNAGPGAFAPYGPNGGKAFRNSFALSVNPFGRGMRGVGSGRSVFGKEYAVPPGDPEASLHINFPSNLYNDIYIYNYEKSVVSPYVLFPEDKLVLAVSKYRSCVSQSAVDGTTTYDFNGPLPLNAFHDIWMDTGSIKISLYGSLVRQNEEFHDTLNSRLDTNSVHEMIHNLVVDEWDVGGTQEFTGSYVSDFMSGSATPSAGSWSRQRFGDTTNFDPNGVFNNSIYRSENLTRYYERMQFNRNAQMSCPDEQFYDSMIPRMDELFRIEGSKSPYNAAVGLGSMLITFDYQDYFTDGFAVIDWTRSFPFEPKYSSLTRTSYIDKVYSQYNVIFFALIGAPAPRPALLGVDENIALETYHPSNPGSGLNVFGEYKSGLFTGLKYTDVIKHMYGSGDWNNVRKGLPSFEDTNSYVGSTCRPYYRTYSPGTSGGAPNYGYSGVLLGALIRGWKYGLMNGTELYSKAVYRRDRYGQFRDMLEQRLDAKFHDGHTSLASPVKVQFIGPKGTTISPENTFSSNLSFEASSSLPYFDGIVRNREEPIYIPSIYSMRFTK